MVRVAGCDTDYGDAVASREPHFNGYYTTGAIQYHPHRRHFRYLRIDFGRATVITATPASKQKETGTKQEKLNEPGWTNYIYTYTIANGKQATQYEGPQPERLIPPNYNRGIYGGADTEEFRIIQWNVRTINNQKTIATKKRILNQTRPIVILLNEGRSIL
jgi:hypothetical protein